MNKDEQLKLGLIDEKGKLTKKGIETALIYAVSVALQSFRNMVDALEEEEKK